MLKAEHQIFWWGLAGRLPDAENFLFLLCGRTQRSTPPGENTANHSNPNTTRCSPDADLDDGPEKQKVMDQMVAHHCAEDAPWAWGYWPLCVGVAIQPWAHNGRPASWCATWLPYCRIDPQLRVAEQAEWNQPVRWPLALIALAG